ncbi:hypothetical protein L7F22_040152 [Adiantum nelumboides]|nr:hypothetical protein [Adiantum nelumboides]
MAATAVGFAGVSQSRVADEAKAKGNAAFWNGKFEEAIKHFSNAIALNPTNHILFSNHSAPYASLHKYQEALKDAKFVALKPDWVKGYSRLGAANVGLGKHEDAIGAYKKGLEYDPANNGLQSGLADVQAAKTRVCSFPSSSSPFSDIFFGLDFWVKVTQNPRTRPYL